MKTERQIDVYAYVADLSDQDLVNKMEVAWQDLQKAAHEQNQSEWHQSCFAACALYAGEMGKRGLKRPSPPSAQTGGGSK